VPSLGGSALADRLRQLLGGLEAVVGAFDREALPEVFAGLERLRRQAELRLAVVPPPGNTGLRALLTAKDVATLLQVSPTEVYRLAKVELRAAAIDVGEGTLRFDPRRVDRFLEARRRG
jgi:hypothetical protein